MSKAKQQTVQTRLITLLEKSEMTAGMDVRIYGDHLILGRTEPGPKGAEPEIVECVRLTRLSSPAFGLSVKRHNGRWERTPFSGRLEDMVGVIHEFMQHLVAPR
jgi:hypothetical protein